VHSSVKDFSHPDYETVKPVFRKSIPVPAEVLSKQRFYREITAEQFTELFRNGLGYLPADPTTSHLLYSLVNMGMKQKAYL
jgi:hypothetical protein